MAKPKRVNAFLASLEIEKTEQSQPQIETVASEEQDMKRESSLTESVETVQQEPAAESEIKANTQTKKKAHLKQVNMTIGEGRELKLDELAFVYTKKKKQRVNRNDIIRYLIDNVTIEELLKVNLENHEK
jgi:hemolysin activation/secretion protein